MIVAGMRKLGSTHAIVRTAAVKAASWLVTALMELERLESTVSISLLKRFKRPEFYGRSA